MTLYVAGILSANLALVNVLPFPPLDGGRMLMLVLKRSPAERISLRAERLTYFVGFALPWRSSLGHRLRHRPRRRRGSATCRPRGLRRR